MSLDLDERQRAMLQEMGVHVWLPLPEAPAPLQVELPQRSAAVAPVAQVPSALAEEMSADAIENIAVSALEAGAAAQKASNSQARAPAPRAAAPAGPVVSGVVPSGIADMDWPTLTQTVDSCEACKLCTGRRAPVFGGASAPAQADWFALGDPPDDAEERAGMAFVDQPGQLLDNMLRAVGASRNDPDVSGAAAAYVTNVVKCRPAVVRIPDAHELATCANYLRREVALVKPKVILAMGRLAAQSVLQDSLPGVATIPLGKLRGQTYSYQGIPVVVTYPPSYLLRTQPDKARAWADLCLASELAQTHPSR